MNSLISMLHHYGYIILYGSLMLEMIALPIPTELLMSYVGYMVYQGHLNLFIAIIIGTAGSISGMRIAYFIGGKLGYPFFQKHGRKVHLGPERIEKMSDAFNSYGKRLLLVSCFIPGIRHLTGYSAGIIQIKYRSFAIFAYIGALIWVGSFISLGDVLGPKYKIIETSAKKYMLYLIVFLILFFIVFYIVKRNLNRMQSYFVALFQHQYQHVRFQWEIKVLVAVFAAAFISLISIVIGLFEEYVQSGFQDFNQTTLLIFYSYVGPQWKPFLTGSQALATIPVLSIAGSLAMLWIIYKGKNRLLEFNMLIIAIAGGIIFVQYLPEAMETAVEWLKLPFGLYGYTVPSKEVILATILYGYFAFLFIRHISSYWAKLAALVLSLVMIFYIGIGQFYFLYLKPSDVIASYVLAGVWLCFIIMLLELWRLLLFVNRELRKS